MTNEEQDQHDPHVVRLSNRQRRFLRNRLKALGFANYRRYLLSPQWADTRARYEASGRPQKCMVCHDPHYELHHRTYKHLGKERLDDLIPLCRDHHDQVHRQQEPLWNGHGALRQQIRRPNGPPAHVSTPVEQVK